jgi:hypothetical protein
MTQSASHSHAEALVDMFVGSAMGQAALWAFGMPLGRALSMNLTLLFLSYWRQYFIRRIFNRIASHGSKRERREGLHIQEQIRA